MIGKRDELGGGLLPYQFISLIKWCCGWQSRELEPFKGMLRGQLTTNPRMQRELVKSYTKA